MLAFEKRVIIPFLSCFSSSHCVQQTVLETVHDILS